MTDDDWATLRVKAETRDLSTSELIRRAVEAYGEAADRRPDLSDEQRAEIAVLVTRDSVSTWFDEPFAVARVHVPDCNGMVLYWRDQGRWRCRKCGQEMPAKAPEKLVTSGSVVAKAA